MQPTALQTASVVSSPGVQQYGVSDGQQTLPQQVYSVPPPCALTVGQHTPPGQATSPGGHDDEAKQVPVLASWQTSPCGQHTSPQRRSVEQQIVRSSRVREQVVPGGQQPHSEHVSNLPQQTRGETWLQTLAQQPPSKHVSPALQQVPLQTL